MENDSLPQYMQIALSIAGRIAGGDVPEGAKISGRSKLSSEYNVSPETIRKAVRLLSDMRVVDVREKSGVYVLSADNARRYLHNAGAKIDVFAKRQQMKELLDVKNYELAKIAPRELPSGATYIGSYGKLGLDFYQYNDWYLDDFTDPASPTTRQLVPDGTIALLSTEAQFSRLYGAITYIPYNGTEFVTEEADRVAHAWIEHNPDRKFLGLDSRPLLVPYEVDSWLVAKVL